jgi:signal transduction histidine kinase
MTRPAWLRDSITRRFAIAIAATAAICVMLNILVDALLGGPAFPPSDPTMMYREPAQWVLRTAILIFAILTVSLIGASRLARPIDAFASAARRFGSDPNAPPMTPQGPAEMQIAIAAFNTMQSQIKRLVEGQAAMFAAISHDLRTPLTRMRLRGEFIEDPDQQARLFRDVDEMQTMIEAMLMFLRDNAANERTTSLDLAELLRSIADDYADIGSDVAYTGPQHVAFPGRPIGLRRAFGNLVDNAVKYGARPTIDLQCQGNAVQVTIIDQGPGIPADALEQVFVPFRRLEPSRNRNTGGMGLGLTSARAGFRAHGGDVILSNATGGGLRATVILPLPVLATA